MGVGQAGTRQPLREAGLSGDQALSRPWRAKRITRRNLVGDVVVGRVEGGRELVGRVVIEGVVVGRVEGGKDSPAPRRWTAPIEPRTVNHHSNGYPSPRASRGPRGRPGRWIPPASSRGGPGGPRGGRDAPGGSLCSTNDQGSSGETPEAFPAILAFDVLSLGLGAPKAVWMTFLMVSPVINALWRWPRTSHAPEMAVGRLRASEMLYRYLARSMGHASRARASDAMLSPLASIEPQTDEYHLHTDRMPDRRYARPSLVSGDFTDNSAVLRADRGLPPISSGDFTDNSPVRAWMPLRWDADSQRGFARFHL